MLSPKKNLLLLLAAFMVPMFVSWSMYYFHGVLHLKTNNQGTLIQPSIALTSTTKQWQIAYAPQACQGADFEKTTFSLHQLWIALGENQKRVRLSLLLPATCHPQNLHGFMIVPSSMTALAELQQVLQPRAVVAQVYLIDPLGNIFMYYPQANLLSLLNDLQKLLRISQIG